MGLDDYIKAGKIAGEVRENVRKTDFKVFSIEFDAFIFCCWLLVCSFLFTKWGQEPWILGPTIHVLTVY